jgi:hypothetical protein
MNAKESKEIIKKPIAMLEDNLDYHLRLKAEGYLAALEGPEVKALVEALEEVARGRVLDNHIDPLECEVSCNCDELISKEALAQYREAVKK